MEERSSHLTVVVGATAIAEELRRSLVQQRVAHAGIATHVRGLRRSVALGDSDLVIICIALDELTLSRHGSALRQLLADHHCFQQSVRSIGLLTEVGLTRDAAQVGCDVYVADSKQASRAMRSLTRRWRSQRSATAKVRSQQRSGPTVQSSAVRNAWMWGTSKLPIEFAPLVSQSRLSKSSRRSRSRSRSDG